MNYFRSESMASGATRIEAARWSSKHNSIRRPPLPRASRRFGKKDPPHRTFIDTSGRVVLSREFDWASSSFSDGMLLVMTGKLYGYCDKLGTIVINPRFVDAGDFAEGLAPVRVGAKWGYIDTTGTIAIPPQFAEAGSFSDGLAYITFDEEPPVRNLGDAFLERDKPETRLWGYIDKQGKVIIPPQFNFAREFSEGLAPVGFGKKSADFLGAETGRKWGFIDTAGRTVINLEFGDVRVFSEGLAPVRVGRKWGYVDRNGGMVIKPQFEDAGSFPRRPGLSECGRYKNILATQGVTAFAIKVVGKHGYIDTAAGSSQAN